METALLGMLLCAPPVLVQMGTTLRRNEQVNKTLDEHFLFLSTNSCTKPLSYTLIGWSVI